MAFSLDLIFPPELLMLCSRNSPDSQAILSSSLHVFPPLAVKQMGVGDLAPPLEDDFQSYDCKQCGRAEHFDKT